MINCIDVDLWLVTHLADLLHKMDVLEPEYPAFQKMPCDVVCFPTWVHKLTMMVDSFELTLRDYFLLRYVDQLQCDAGLWRLSLEYLATCGLVGKARMRQVLLGAPILSDQEGAPAETNGDGDVSEKTTTVLEVLSECRTYGRENDARAICRVRLNRIGVLLSPAKVFSEDIRRASNASTTIWFGCLILDSSWGRATNCSNS